MGGKQLLFEIVHPGFGQMIDNGICHPFDLRDRMQNAANWRTETAISSENLDHLPNFDDFLREDEALSQHAVISFALLPLRSRYFITVAVSGDVHNYNWQSVSQIDALTLTLVAIR